MATMPQRLLVLPAIESQSLASLFSVVLPIHDAEGGPVRKSFMDSLPLAILI